MHLPVLYEKKYIACDNVSLHKHKNSTNISMNVVMPTAQLSIHILPEQGLTTDQANFVTNFDPVLAGIS